RGGDNTRTDHTRFAGTYVRFDIVEGTLAGKQSRARNDRSKSIDEMDLRALANFGRQLALQSARNVTTELACQWGDLFIVAHVGAPAVFNIDPCGQKRIDLSQSRRYSPPRWKGVVVSRTRHAFLKNVTESPSTLATARRVCDRLIGRSAYADTT